MLRSLAFKARKPTGISVYEEFFKVRSEFSAGKNLATFDRKRMEQPLLQANALKPATRR